MRTLRPAGAIGILLAAAALAGDSTSLHYRVLSAGSELRWNLPATLHTVHGTAPKLSGTVNAERGPGGEWRVQSRIVVDAAAMVTGNASRDQKMRERILETGRFPEIVFEGKHVVADLSRFGKEQHFTVEVMGDLTVHGKSESLRLPVDVFVFPDYVVLSGSFPLLWKQFGLADPSFGLVKVREPLKVLFRLKAVPA